MNVSKSVVREGEAFEVSVDVRNLVKYTESVHNDYEFRNTKIVYYEPGDVYSLSKWGGSSTYSDFDGGQTRWEAVVDENYIARFRISVTSDLVSEGEEDLYLMSGDWDYFSQQIRIVDSSTTPVPESIVNNGVYVNGDNNGAIDFSSFNGTDGNDFIQGDTLSDRSDRLVGGNGNDRLLGYNGSDYLQGDGGDDFLHGMHGKDQINGGEGNDTMRGGHGHDEIGGGSGGDWIWGGIGKNTISVGTNDNAKDDVYVPVDIFQNTNGNPFGANADILQELGTEDKIFMHGEGLNDGMLSYGQVNHDGKDGVGIFVNGSIEALVVGGLNVGQVDAMTTGGFFA